jgi:hypothetical protein
VRLSNADCLQSTRLYLPLFFRAAPTSFIACFLMLARTLGSCGITGSTKYDKLYGFSRIFYRHIGARVPGQLRNERKAHEKVECSDAPHKSRSPPVAPGFETCPTIFATQLAEPSLSMLRHQPVILDEWCDIRLTRHHIKGNVLGSDSLFPLPHRNAACQAQNSTRGKHSSTRTIDCHVLLQYVVFADRVPLP